MKPSGTIVGDLALDGPGLRGYAYDGADLTRRIVVELFVDGWPIDLARADDFSPEAAGIGDGCHGFGFRLPDVVLDGGGSIEVRVANTGEVIGGDLTAPGRRTACVVAGRVDWAGGLRLTGWVEPPASGGTPRVRVVVERRTVAEADARGFVAAGRGALRRTKARFDVRLPAVFADGRVHRVSILDGQGRDLEGSPCAVLAFADDLRAALLPEGSSVDGDPRAALIERLLPRSVPFGDVEAWLARHPAPPPKRSGRDATVAVLVLGTGIEPTLASLGEQDHGSWLAIAVPDAGGPGTFDPVAVAAALAAEDDLDVVLVLPAGARLRPRALARVAALALDGGAAVYADALVETSAGPLPLLWPAYDPERQLEQGYAALAFAAPAAAARRALRNAASSTFALFDDVARGATPIHLPELLFELKRPDPELGRTLAVASRTGAEGEATPLVPDLETGLPRVHVRRAPSARALAVAVIQPEPWMPDLSAIAARLPGAVERRLVSHRPIPVPAGWQNVVVAGGRNPSRLRDAVLGSVRSAHLLFLDAGVEPESGEAAVELIARLAGGAVAAGGLLVGADGLVASAGLVLGPDFAPSPAFAGFDPEDGGYAGALASARSCGALDAAALIVDRAAASAAGGFDAVPFPERCGAVDLCLKLRAAGGRLVFAPRARFVRHRAWRDGGLGRGAGDGLAILRRRWGEDLADDPYYHPGLNGDAVPFTALAWPSRHRGPRCPEPPRPRPMDPEVS